MKQEIGMILVGSLAVTSCIYITVIRKPARETMNIIPNSNYKLEMIQSIGSRLLNCRLSLCKSSDCRIDYDSIFERIRDNNRLINAGMPDEKGMEIMIDATRAMSDCQTLISTCSL